MKREYKLVLYALGAFMLGYIVLSADWIEFYTYLQVTPVKVIVLLLFYQCITKLLINIQWKSLASEVCGEVSFLDVVLANATGDIMDGLTPGVKMGGELGRIFALKSRVDIDIADASIIVGLQKTFSLFSFLLLTLGSVTWFSLSFGGSDKYYLYIFTAAIAAFIVIFAALILFVLKPETIMGRLGRISRGSKTIIKIEESLKKYSQILRRLFSNKRLFCSQMLLGIFIWSFYAFKLHVLVKSYHIQMGFFSLAAITFLSYAMGMIPLLPGGMGSFESCMILLLKLSGISVEMGAAIAIVFRLVTFWFEFILSGLILILASVPAICRGDNDVKIQV